MRLILTLLLLGTAAALGQEPPPEAAPSDETLLSLLAKGGPVMVPLAIASVVALTIAVERFLTLRADRLVPPGFLDGLKKTGKDATASLAYCDAGDSPLARMLKSGIKNLPRGDAAVEKAIEDAGAREAHRLHRSLRGLSVIAAVSPLLGLLGTVYGLIGAFQEATAKELGKGQELAAGIYEALVTTAAGLTLAIPVLLAYQFLRTRADRVVDALTDVAEDFADHYFTDGKSRP